MSRRRRAPQCVKTLVSVQGFPLGVWKRVLRRIWRTSVGGRVPSLGGGTERGRLKNERHSPNEGKMASQLKGEQKPGKKEQEAGGESLSSIKGSLRKSR